MVMPAEVEARPRQGEVPTDPQRSPVQREASLGEAFAPTRASPSGLRPNPPVLLPATEFSRRPLEMREPLEPPVPPDPSGQMPAMQEPAASPPSNEVAPFVPRMAPPERAAKRQTSSTPRKRTPPPGGNGLVIAATVAVIVAMLAIFSVFGPTMIAKFKGPPGVTAD